MKPTHGLIIKKEHLDKMFDIHPIFLEPKSMEMRSTKTKIRGRIYLIESGSGMIIGETTLYDCTKKLPCFSLKWYHSEHQVDDFELLKKWCFGWKIKDTVKYDKPIPYDHPKGAVIWVKFESK